MFSALSGVLWSGEGLTTKRPPGRPRLFDEPASASISVKVTPAQRLELRRVASDNGTGMAGIIREAVNEYVADYGDRRPFRSAKLKR
jgi:hypothetical protein